MAADGRPTKRPRLEGKRAVKPSRKVKSPPAPVSIPHRSPSGGGHSFGIDLTLELLKARHSPTATIANLYANHLANRHMPPPHESPAGPAGTRRKPIEQVPVYEEDEIEEQE